MYFQQHFPHNALATDCIKISASKWSQCRLSEGMKQKIKSILKEKRAGESNVKSTWNKYENHFNPLQTKQPTQFYPHSVLHQAPAKYHTIQHREEEHKNHFSPYSHTFSEVHGGTGSCRFSHDVATRLELVLDNKTTQGTLKIICEKQQSHFS